MKISQSWLADWVELPHGGDALAEQLTMAGLEVDAVTSLAPGFHGVVVARIVELTAHPDADKLRVAQVDLGDGTLRQVVCGAPNARVGLVSALATVGGELPGGMRIRKAKLRGVVSEGMLCSAAELGLDEDAAGILELPAEAPVGRDLGDWLGLDDTVIDVDLTPNRGDCFSVRGVARELAALNDSALTGPASASVPATHDGVLPVRLAAPEACARFAGRIIRNLQPGRRSPTWLTERLRRAGIRAIHPVVDITNYVMLELGQPLHGYDLAQLSGGITVRFAVSGESLVLLDGREVTLAADMLVIADDQAPVGLAGVMGGQSSAVNEATTEVFLEAAWFAPEAIAGRARRLGLHTDASVRFERGVDFALPEQAIERATALLLEICGGTPGPVQVVEVPEHLPQRPSVALRAHRLQAVLGTTLEPGEVARIFTRLGLVAESTAEGWSVTPPSQRYDIQLEVDLIEEVARIHGYDRIPRLAEQARLGIRTATESRTPEERVRQLLVDRGYQEAVTYSFIDERVQTQFFPGEAPIRLANPIAAQMNVMRRSPWPGLAAAARDNLSRQQARIRLFELGAQFELGDDGEVHERQVIAGLALGPVWPLQWDLPDRRVDFFDVKGDLEALLTLGNGAERWTFVPGEHAALHPGQCAVVLRDREPAGHVGALHPRLAGALELPRDTFLFVVDVAAALGARVPGYRSVSRYPAVHRDLAVVVDERVLAEQLLESVRGSAGPWLQSVEIFDIYRGDRIDKGRKSIALSLILQAPSRTLTDADVEGVVDSVIDRLGSELGARIRD
ncbi:MAG: phenylalanine--tRNA ligase subunit beta [Gammaproteobacteria bacterium]|nr:MAG: phenylalanine--tRNA ligase subunit beta [Gammaproteobacteria bacterium]